MTEGTKSVLLGAHQFILHPILVLIQFMRFHKRFPQWWELVGIFLHDMGYCGLNYLSNKKSKPLHVYRSAALAKKLLSKLGRGDEVFEFIMGHLGTYPVRSDLYWPDKLSQLITPKSWLYWEKWVEGFEKSPDEWMEIVKDRIANDKIEWRNWE
jgi:hypothetical protein